MKSFPKDKEVKKAVQAKAVLETERNFERLLLLKEKLTSCILPNQILIQMTESLTILFNRPGVKSRRLEAQ